MAGGPRREPDCESSQGWREIAPPLGLERHMDCLFTLHSTGVEGCEVLHHQLLIHSRQRLPAREIVAAPVLTVEWRVALGVGRDPADPRGLVGIEVGARQPRPAPARLDEVPPDIQRLEQPTVWRLHPATSRAYASGQWVGMSVISG
jgi:hypothetical protein